MRAVEVGQKGEMLRGHEGPGSYSTVPQKPAGQAPLTPEDELAFTAK